MQKTLRILLNIAIVAGCVLMLWPLAQTAYGKWSQQQLKAEWEKEVAQNTTTPDANQPAKSTLSPSNLSSSTQSSTQAATTVQVQRPKLKVAPWPKTRLIIPEIGVDTVVLQGWDDATLRRAPGHAPTTSPPGEGNCVIAAHRNVYGSWFRRMDELLPDSIIKLQTPTETLVYRVALSYSVADTDTTILQPPPDDRPRLTLVTCTLPRSAARLVTVAVMEDPNRAPSY